MGIPVHVSNVIDGSNPSQPDRRTVAIARNVPLAAGSGAGAAVVIDLTASFPGGELPADGSYVVSADAGQGVVYWADTKGGNGFKLHLLPYPATNTITAGTVNVKVEA